MPPVSDASHKSQEGEGFTATEIAVGAALSAAAIGGMVVAKRLGVFSRAATGAAEMLPETRIVGDEIAGLAAKATGMVPKSEYVGRFVSGADAFQENGRLVAGTHKVSWSELAEHFGKTPERQQLLERFLPIARDLKAAKVKELEIGGSFASTKPVPKDIDFVWNNQQPGFSPMRLRWHNKDLMTAETDALQYRGIHNVNGHLKTDGTKSGAYSDALLFLKKVKVEPKVDFDIGSMRGYDDFKKLADLRQQARIDAARIEEEMKAAGTLYGNGVLQLDLGTVPKLLRRA